MKSVSNIKECLMLTLQQNREAGDYNLRLFWALAGMTCMEPIFNPQTLPLVRFKVPFSCMCLN